MAAPTQVEEALYEALAESRGTTAYAVRAEVGTGGDIDSLEGVELVAVVEERFNVRIADRELTSHVCSSIPRLARLVAAKTTSPDRARS